jgi:site-specific DNA-methyltransferase (adenine-specific)
MLLNKDMLLADADIADLSVDLLLTDPPYNISEGGAKPVWIDPETGKSKNTIHSQKFSESFDEDWDSVTHDEFVAQMESWAEFWFRKVRRGGTFAVFISDQYISYLWKIMESAGFEPKRVITWKKPAAVPFNRQVNLVSGCEYILWGIKPKGDRTFNADAARGTIVERYTAADKISSIVYKYAKDVDTEQDLEQVFEKALKDAQQMLRDRKRAGNVIQCVVPNTVTFSGGTSKKIHPTQKPVELLEYLIELFSREEDLVLDTFAGSGSTGLAAQKRNRRFVLIERDPKMFAEMSKQFAGVFE